MNEHKVNTISVQELKKRVDETPDLCIIDVREQHEWNEVHIPGALHIPKDELVACIAEKVADKKKPLYLHCRGGVRSLSAAQFLIELGYQEVYSIDGGIVEWEQNGYAVKRGA